MKELINDLFLPYLIIAVIYYIFDFFITIYIVRKYNQEAKLFNKDLIGANWIGGKLFVNIFIAPLWIIMLLYEFLFIVISIIIGNKSKFPSSFKQWYLNWSFNDFENYPYCWEIDKHKNINKSISNNIYTNLKQELWLLKHVPRKYKYITKDKNGDITVHKQKPINIDGYWFASEMRIFPTESCLEIVKSSLENPLEIKEVISLIEKVLEEQRI